MAQEIATSTEWKSYFDLHQYMEPFWKSDTIYDETILPIKDGNDFALARLLFKAKKIIYVKDAYLKKKFKCGRDWIYKDGKIILPQNSSIPFFSKDDLVFTKEKPWLSFNSKKIGTFVLFKEGYFFGSKQVKVTYIPNLAKPEPKR